MSHFMWWVMEDLPNLVIRWIEFLWDRIWPSRRLWPRWARRAFIVLFPVAVPLATIVSALVLIIQVVLTALWVVGIVASFIILLPIVALVGSVRETWK